MIRLGKRGDTLVEVLVCIMIVSLILTGAYATTNRSTLGIRNSQEHAEALKLAQSQLELLRQASKQASAPIFTQAAPFCMSGSTPTSADGAPGAACKVDGSGAPTTAEPQYKIKITRADSTTSAVFTVAVDWDSVIGSTAHEQLAYRLYK